MIGPTAAIGISNSIPLEGVQLLDKFEGREGSEAMKPPRQWELA